ncbi:MULTISPECIES: hypothetical protein [unclassified Collinsella]|jgi:hypothetical protein|uniref:hypothetical protein n=1 Tax=unclassified Collinsella TaxID=2637548 RepID=UPI000E439A62|nr:MULTISPECIES: hypothetical protein [unclassified Collinsella]RGM73496.1 hypothetical protein DXB98_05070 [Collinsella sp. OM07-12]RHJ36559.1 hypothetical protein DW129_08585 [Collinsella sp. AM10-48]RHJ37464.1 hypothetical protein DW126_08570 [Collinsella sp. AM10-32]RHJ42699.1 hypothetical protein DW124_08375 [Collinsella sp. AM10-27]RHJ42944.1 hypothetical protein DW123_08595 [Collinsella sp. AM10-26]
MFHEITDKELRARKRRGIIAAAVAVLLVVAIAGGAFFIRRAQREQGAVALRNSILNSARQCCAIEGSYPKTVEHLEEHYGLIIDHDDYVVSYEHLADNIVPSVVVMPR